MSFPKMTPNPLTWILFLGLAVGLTALAGAQMAPGPTSTPTTSQTTSAAASQATTPDSWQTPASSTEPGTSQTTSPANGEVAPGTSLKATGAYSLSGTVVSSTTNSLVITDSSGHTRNFVLDPQAPYEAAMNAGDEVRVQYDPIQGGMDLAKNVQTLNVTANMSRREERREMLAASESPTRVPGEGNLMAQASTPESPNSSATTSPNASSTPPSTASSTASSTAPGATGTKEELPGTASPLPLVAAAGFLSLILAFGVGLLRRRADNRA